MNVDVGRLYSKVSFKSMNEWIFFKVTFKDDLAGAIQFNLFVNSTRKEPPFTLVVRHNDAHFFLFLFCV
jgi:hypothetical protein